MGSGFYEWWENIDRKVSKALIVMFSLFIISQILLINQTAKTFISRTDRLEGISVEDSQLFVKKGEIEIYIENHSTLKPLVFYINGERVPAAEGRSVKLSVKDRDVIEVSGAGYSEMAILKVVSVSDNVTVPELGKLIYVNNNLVMIDRVRLK